jgi:hypothetical protein
VTTWLPLSAKVGTNFADKWRSLGWCSPLAESSHGVRIYHVIMHTHCYGYQRFPCSCIQSLGLAISVTETETGCTHSGRQRQRHPRASSYIQSLGLTEPVYKCSLSSYRQTTCTHCVCCRRRQCDRDRDRLHTQRQTETETPEGKQRIQSRADHVTYSPQQARLTDTEGFLHRTRFVSGRLEGIRCLTSSVASVRDRTTPTKRPPLVGEVTANF